MTRLSTDDGATGDEAPVTEGPAKPIAHSRRLAELFLSHRAASPDQPLPAITIRNRRDGGGAQALGVVSALLWSEATGCRYLHTPFSTVGHAPGDRGAWAAQWETFLNLGQDEAPVPADARVVDPAEYLADQALQREPGIVLGSVAFHHHAFQTRDALRRMRTVLRTKYHAADKSALMLHHGASDALAVAVHIRRGDVTETKPDVRHRYTQDEPILKTIQHVRSAVQASGRKTEVHVYSEGPSAMFEKFASQGCHLHLDGDAIEAFHNLVSAAILVQAKSSFSYVAGLISTGVVLREHYNLYRGAPGWIQRGPLGGFDEALLRRALRPKRPWYHRPFRPLRRWLAGI